MGVFVLRRMGYFGDKVECTGVGDNIYVSIVLYRCCRCRYGVMFGFTMMMWTASVVICCGYSIRA